MDSTPVKRDWPKAPQNFVSTDTVPEFSNIKTHLLNNDAVFKQLLKEGWWLKPWCISKPQKLLLFGINLINVHMVIELLSN